MALAPLRQPVHLPPQAQLTLPIEGMSCASCVARVETAIRAVPGVKDVSVNLATERATIMAGADLALPVAAHAIKQAGYTVGAETLDILCAA